MGGRALRSGRGRAVVIAIASTARHPAQADAVSVYVFGDATFNWVLSTKHVLSPVVTLAATADGSGVLASDR